MSTTCPYYAQIFTDFFLILYPICVIREICGSFLTRRETTEGFPYVPFFRCTRAGTP